MFGFVFGLSDEYVLKRMIILIAFSQQVRASLVSGMMERGVFERVFPSFSPEAVSRMDPSALRETYWNNPSRPDERLSPLRFPSKLDSMVGCGRSVQAMAQRYGSFMRYLQSRGFPSRIRSSEDINTFWIAFEKTRSAAEVSFFRNFTSLCHLLQDLGFDCAKPDSVVMNVAVDLDIAPQPQDRRQHSDRNRRKVVEMMQLYGACNGMRTPVVDLYFLIRGGQSDAKKFVEPSYYAPESL